MVDPEGLRTLAVITKLDLMDKGTDAMVKGSFLLCKSLKLYVLVSFLKFLLVIQTREAFRVSRIWSLYYKKKVVQTVKSSKTCLIEAEFIVNKK